MEMSHKVKAHLIGLGKYLPTKVLANQDFEKMVETTNDWIVTRTGIEERRIAHDQEFTSHMGTKAAAAAIDDAGIALNEIELILVATATPDYTINSTAALIQDQLGLPCVGGMDLQAACSGFIYALATAQAFIESGMYKTVLVVASEKMSSFIDYTDRNTCVLFGDGAAAAILSTTPKGYSIGAHSLASQGKYAELVYMPAGGVRNPATKETVENRMHYIKMQGKEVFKLAVRNMCSAATDCMQKMGIDYQDIDWVVPHQANARIIDALGKECGIEADKIYRTVHKYGNTSASSIPIALQEFSKAVDVKPGQKILLVSFGAGLTWAATILTKV